MPSWNKVRFFYDTMIDDAGSTLVATSTEATGDFDVDYLFNWREIDLWQAEESGIADPQYITLDLGGGNTATADYLCILGHNLNTVGATVTLQYSTDNFSGDINDAFTGEAPGADTVYLKEFTAPAVKRYWRLKIAGHGVVAPFMAICVWGLTTELDYGWNSYDPHGQNVKANRGLSQGGYDTGAHIKYTERKFNIQFNNADAALYNKVKTWWDSHNIKNLFVAWESANNPLEVWLMRPDMAIDNPLTNGGAYRDITINLTGRKENG